MSEVQTALLGALRDLQHPGDDRTAVVRQTDAELHGPGVYHHGDAGRRPLRRRLGGGPQAKARPLLVIAGAGSGKTKTLAHRVAHLVVSGVDPHRILLLTFTRRAAEEMIRRVKRITAKAIGTQQVELPWSGTFHAIGAHILRQHATQIGLKPSFTILDRADAADLMDLVRHELGLSNKASRFPKKDTCLAIYSFIISSGKPIDQVLAKHFPWCVEEEK